MKNKLIMFSFMVIMLITITGCGNSNTKTLTCSVSSNENDRKSTSNLKIKIKNNEIKDMTLTLNVTLPREQQEYKQVLMSQMRQKTDQVYATSDGVRAVFGMDSSYFNNLGVSRDATISEIKQVLEIQGYTCEDN